MQNLSFTVMKPFLVVFYLIDSWKKGQFLKFYAISESNLYFSLSNCHGEEGGEEEKNNRRNNYFSHPGFGAGEVCLVHTSMWYLVFSKYISK